MGGWGGGGGCLLVTDLVHECVFAHSSYYYTHIHAIYT